MSTQAPKAKAVKSNLTSEQRAWLKKLGAVVDSAGDAAADEVAAPTRGTQPAGPGTQRVAALGGKPASTKEALGPGALIPVIPVVIDALKIKCTCKVLNRSQQKLLLNKIKLDHPTGNGFEKAPADEIAPGGSDEFVVVNKAPFHLGVLGEMEYQVEGENPETIVFIRWEHARSDDIPIIGTDTEAKMEVRPPNAKKFEATKNVNSDLFTFLFKSKGGAPPPPQPQPGPGPGPSPAPAQDIRSNCQITVNNKTNLVLTLADQGHDRGDFMTFPPQTIAPGASAQFVSVETPHGKEQGCKGFVSWEVGSPSAAIWRCEWDNPEADKNTAKAPAEPQSAGFRTLAQIGQDDENVPVVFTISGGGTGPAPQPTPSPSPSPAPEPEPAFLAPPGSRQPTLRKGDKKADGWVEYLQHVLNDHLGAGTVDVDGSFGQKTLNAVIKFQTQNKLKVDGIVGNQTWAALRLEKPEAPSTDGRTPHTFEQTDLQARWEVDDTPDAIYVEKIDRLTLNVVSVGEGKIDDFSATVRITPPGTPAKVVKVKIGPPFQRTANDQGNKHAVTLLNFKKNFPAKDPNAKIEDYLVEAFFDKELGPDLFKGHITVQK
jgi:peptidoglycan hydrolase-like protein with peptidoglycan-binding domain